ncbi:hypothetical protein D3C85_1066210 [compost metagenome]
MPVESETMTPALAKPTMSASPSPLISTTIRGTWLLLLHCPALGLVPKAASLCTGAAKPLAVP